MYKVSKFFIFSFLCIIVLLGSNAYGNYKTVEKDTLKILFVGNSFTYFYNLPQVLSSLSKYSNKIHFKTKHSLVGGSTIRTHLNQKRGTKTINILNEEIFDYVIINHHSLATINDHDSFIETSKQIVNLVRSKSAIPVFMQTWAYYSKPLMINTIASAYKEMSELLSVDIIPCGQILSEVRKRRPELNLFDDDDKHPSKNATYINALAFFKYFTNEKTKDIPKRITTIDKNNQKLYLSLIHI